MAFCTTDLKLLLIRYEIKKTPDKKSDVLFNHKIYAMFFLTLYSAFLMNNMLNNIATISATGNDSHTSSSLPNFERRYAAGTSTTNWRPTDIKRLYIPNPNAWHTELVITEMPAKIKLRLIILSAGIPISSIESDALNNNRSLSGIV
jgi:hypothetical protein